MKCNGEKDYVSIEARDPRRWYRRMYSTETVGWTGRTVQKKKEIKVSEISTGYFRHLSQAIRSKDIKRLCVCVQMCNQVNPTSTYEGWRQLCPTWHAILIRKLTTVSVCCFSTGLVSIVSVPGMDWLRPNTCTHTQIQKQTLTYILMNLRKWRKRRLSTFRGWAAEL